MATTSMTTTSASTSAITSSIPALISASSASTSAISTHEEIVQMSAQYGYNWNPRPIPSTSPKPSYGNHTPVDQPRLPEAFLVDEQYSTNSTLEFPSSSPSNAPSLGPRSIGLSIPIQKDATISEAQPISFFGADPTLVVDGTLGSQCDTMISIDLSFLVAVVDYESIVLQLFVLEADGDYCGSFQTTMNPWWTEESVTWTNAPGLSGEVIGEAQGIMQAEWFELDVTAVVAAKKAASENTLSLRIDSRGASRCVFSSISGDVLHAPNLLVKLNGKNSM
jgi:hypothetical protein